MNCAALSMEVIVNRSSLTLAGALIGAALLAGCAGKDDTGSQQPQDQGAPGGPGADDTGITNVETGGGTDLGDGGQLDTSTGSFACGELTCLGAYEFCHVTLSGTKGSGEERDYSCELTPESCLPEPTCDCLSSTGAIDGKIEQCSADGDGNLFVELALP